MPPEMAGQGGTQAWLSNLASGLGKLQLHNRVELVDRVARTVVRRRFLT